MKRSSRELHGIDIVCGLHANTNRAVFSTQTYEGAGQLRVSCMVNVVRADVKESALTKLRDQVDDASYENGEEGQQQEENEAAALDPLFNSVASSNGRLPFLWAGGFVGLQHLLDKTQRPIRHFHGELRANFIEFRLIGDDGRRGVENRGRRHRTLLLKDPLWLCLSRHNRAVHSNDSRRYTGLA